MKEAQEINQDRISRREFFKVAGLTTAGISLPNFLNSPENTSNKPTKIETDQAIYYPFYERHPQGISFDEISKVQDIDIHFLETVFPSNDTLSLTPKDLLFMESAVQSGGILSGEPSYKRIGRLISEEMLSFFSKKGSQISIEGYILPFDAAKQYISSMAAEAMVGAGLAAHKAVRFSDLEEKTKKDSARLVFGLTGSAWLTSPVLSSLGVIIEENPTRTLQKIFAYVYHTHPEFPIVFLRNALMARKLDLLAKYQQEKQEEKPSISYAVGYGHAGIEDFLILGEKSTLTAISIYPKGYLQNTVDLNGGLDFFCSTVVVPVRENLEENQEVKHIIVDEKLRAYLENRLK